MASNGCELASAGQNTVTADHQHNFIAADIVLYRSAGWIAQAIRYFDAAEASQAGLLVSPGRLAECVTGRGLQHGELAACLASSKWVAVRRLVAPHDAIDPVLLCAAQYLEYGDRYCYEPILLLAGIFLLRPMDLRAPEVRYLVKTVLDKATAVLRRCQEDGEQPLLCSEFVWRSHDEADSREDNPFALQVPPFSELGVPARRIGSQRNGRGLPAASAVPAESLLGLLQQRYGSLPAALHTTPGAAALAPPPQVSDAVLDMLIEAIVDQRSGPGRNAAVASELPVLILHDLRTAVQRLANALHDVTEGGRRLGAGAFRARLLPAWATPAETLLEYAADFITPGDLLRSASLMTVAEGHISPPDNS
jgi:hypothetical protein